MEPIIKIVKPFSYISIIKIYSPKIKKINAISFLIKIDDNFINIDLFNDGAWQDTVILKKYPIEVLNLIVEEIKFLYL